MKSLIEQAKNADVTLVNGVKNCDYSMKDFQNTNLGYKISDGFCDIFGTSVISSYRPLYCKRIDANFCYELGVNSQNFIFTTFNGESKESNIVPRGEIFYLGAIIDSLTEFDIADMNNSDNVMQCFVNLPNDFFGKNSVDDRPLKAQETFAKYFPLIFKSMYLGSEKRKSIATKLELAENVIAFTKEFPDAFGVLKDRVVEARSLRTYKKKDEALRSIDEMGNSL